MVWFLVFLFLDALVDFLTVHSNFLRRIHTDTHLISFDAQYSHGDVITDHQGLSDPASQNQHSFLLTCYGISSLQKKKWWQIRIDQVHESFTQVLTSPAGKKVPVRQSKTTKGAG